MERRGGARVDATLLRAVARLLSRSCIARSTWYAICAEWDGRGIPGSWMWFPCHAARSHACAHRGKKSERRETCLSPGPPQDEVLRSLRPPPPRSPTPVLTGHVSSLPRTNGRVVRHNIWKLATSRNACCPPITLPGRTSRSQPIAARAGTLRGPGQGGFVRGPVTASCGDHGLAGRARLHLEIAAGNARRWFFIIQSAMRVPVRPSPALQCTATCPPSRAR
jgi:hypothetical protein